MPGSTGLCIGCVADDFTGASDIASFFCASGLKTLLIKGIPDDDLDFSGYHAIVIALKSRTAPLHTALSETACAFAWLDHHHARQKYFKYCSTFDSTPAGNIGPVLDLLLETGHIPYTILCPALPINRRIVKNGCLYVDGVPLNESPMKNHPLTPMWASSIKELMEPQSKYPCFNLTAQDLALQDREIKQKIEQWEKRASHFYIIPDYTSEDHGRRIAQLFAGLQLISGGSGLALHLGRNFEMRSDQPPKTTDIPRQRCRSLLLAGSCSAATLRQISTYTSHGHSSVKIEPLEILTGRQSINSLWNFVEQHQDDAVLLYSSDSPKNIRRIQEYGTEKVAALVESTFASLGKLAIENHFENLIVAGGETSGAVIQALNSKAFEIGESIAPGVPIMTPIEHLQLRLALKSGNFGQNDFFQCALDIMNKR